MELRGIDMGIEFDEEQTRGLNSPLAVVVAWDRPWFGNQLDSPTGDLLFTAIRKGEVKPYPLSIRFDNGHVGMWLTKYVPPKYIEEINWLVRRSNEYAS